VGDHLGYVLADPEVSNFTYELENGPELVAWLDEHFAAGAFVRELEEDIELDRELRLRLRRHLGSKARVLFGRRAGWYAIVRALRPGRIVETGTHDGLGSVVLLTGAAGNGHGEVVSIDPRSGSGWLVPDRLRSRCRPLCATSYDALPSVGKVDLFMHDSLHTPECERWELETARRLGASVLMSDNAHAADTCASFAAAHGAALLVWRERPGGHFYPGAGIGVVLFDPNRTEALAVLDDVTAS
jgi:hypothetical protein